MTGTLTGTRDHGVLHMIDDTSEHDRDLEVVEGVWPAGLGGHAYFIGPAQPAQGGLQWGGPGILTRVDLAGTPHLVSKRLRTPEIDLLTAAAPHIDPMEMAGIFALRPPNLSNTSVHWLGERLFVTFDPGRPIEIDPATFGYLSHAGGVAEYPEVAAHPLFPGVYTTAHPVEDLDEGCWWWCNVRFAPDPSSDTDVVSPLHVVRWDGDGNLATWRVEGVTVRQGIHEVTVSEDYVIFTEVGFKIEPGTFWGGERTRPHLPYTDVYLVAKRDLTTAARATGVRATRARLPLESFHEFADYRQDGDVVTLHVAHSNGFDINLPLHPDDRVWGTEHRIPERLVGFMPNPCDAAPITRYAIDGRTGAVRGARSFSHPDRHWGPTLYNRTFERAELERGTHMWQGYWGYQPEHVVERHVRLYADHPNRSVPVDRLPREPVASSLACIRLDDMSDAGSWSFGADAFGTSPVHATDPAGGEGWAVLLVQRPHRTEVQVFDALHVDRGPVAVAAAPDLQLTYQVHSGWAPRLPRSRGSSYARPLAGDLGDWRALAPDLVAAVRPVIAAYS